MREINKTYFSSISKIVNNKAYNNFVCKPTNDCFIVTIDRKKSETNSYILSSLAKNGFIIVNVGIYTEDKLAELIFWLENLFGPYNNKNPGKLPYAKVKREENARYYINSNLAQPVHTDEGYTSRHPKYVGLYCFQQAALGGESIVVQVERLYQSLVKQFNSLVELIFKRNAITVYGLHGREQKPLLFKIENNQIGISYSSILQKMWCEEEIFSMYDYITKYIHDVENQIRIKLKPGQILLFDNRRILHGRTAFPANTDRLLYRFWFGDNSL